MGKNHDGHAVLQVFDIIFEPLKLIVPERA